MNETRLRCGDNDHYTEVLPNIESCNVRPSTVATKGRVMRLLMEKMIGLVIAVNGDNEYVNVLVH